KTQIPTIFVFFLINVSLYMRYSFYEEVHGVATNGSNRRIDIIAFKPSSKIDSITVTGLMIGASGTIPGFLAKFSNFLDLDRVYLSKIAIAAIRGSILRNYLYKMSTL
ncbi:hypothetical protein L9F63_015237, partial [Diploptera punctata]